MCVRMCVKVMCPCAQIPGHMHEVCNTLWFPLCVFPRRDGIGRRMLVVGMSNSNQMGIQKQSFLIHHTILLLQSSVDKERRLRRGKGGRYVWLYVPNSGIDHDNMLKLFEGSRVVCVCVCVCVCYMFCSAHDPWLEE